MTGKNRNDPNASGPPPARAGGKASAEPPPDEDAQEQSTLEAFDEEGAGIAPKE
jgi:hypothetical protein